MSGSYKINGVDFIIQPTSGKWLERSILDIDGNGHPVYPGVRQFELNWQLLEPSGTYQMIQFFNSIHITGSAVLTLPRFGHYEYDFFAYSGCSVYEPSFGRYFTAHTTDITLLIGTIRT